MPLRTLPGVLLVLCLGGLGALGAETICETVYETGFEPGQAERHAGVNGRAFTAGDAALAARGILPAAGAGAWHADLLASRNEFTPILRTALRLRGDAIYEAEFDYRIVGEREGGHLFAVLASPTATWADAATGYTSLPAAGDGWQRALVRGVASPLRGDLELTILAAGRVEAVIDNLRIRRCAEVPALDGVGDRAAAAAVATAAPVTGAGAVVVDAPRPHAGPVLSVADFGASPDRADNAAAFAAALAACRTAKASALVVPRGTYRFGDFPHSGFTINGMSDFTLDGQGSAFVFYSSGDKPTFITITNSTRCRFTRFSVDWDYARRPLASHLRVVGRGDDGSVGLEFVDYAEFPDRSLLDRLHGLVPLDNATLQPGRPNETPLRVVGPARWDSGNRVNLRLKYPGDAAPRLGDQYLLSHTYWGGYAIYADRSSHLSFQGVDVFASKGFGFYFVRTDGVHLDACRVVPNPDATPKRLISTCSDGFDALNPTRGDYLIENCEFSHTGDDFINLNPTSLCGLRYTDDARTIIAGTDFPSVSFPLGERVEFRRYDFSPAGFASTVTARAAEGAEAVRVTFADPVPPGLEARTIYFFARNQVRNFIIRNNRFHHGYCRGVLPCGRDGTIEGNRFEANAMPDLLITVDFLTRNRIEGNGIGNLLIRGNTFTASNRMGLREAATAIYAHMWRPGTWFPIQSGIAITGNEFIDPAGSVLCTSSVDDLRFEANRIRLERPHPAPFALRGAAVIGSHSGRVTVADNTWSRADAALPAGGAVFSPAETRAVTVQGNRSLVEARP